MNVGTYTVTVVDQGYTACSTIGGGSQTSTVTVSGGSGSSTTASPDTTICPGNPVQLHSSPSGTVVWNTKQGLSDSTVNNPVATVYTTTTYTVTITAGGCTGTSTVTLNVLPNLPTTAFPDTSICSGEPVQLHSSPSGTVVWNTKRGLNDSTVNNPVATLYTTTTYTVRITSGGCSGTSTVTVTVFPDPPTPTITESKTYPDTLFCAYDPGISTYQWYNSGTLLPGETNPTYITTKSGNYNCAVTDTNGCMISVGITIVIKTVGIEDFSSNASIYVYPNPAGKELRILTDALRIENAEIYNALGALVFSQKQETKNHKAETILDVSSLSSGVYFLELHFPEGTTWKGRFVKK